MGIWKMLKRPRAMLKKVKFLYEPYRIVKCSFVARKRRKALHKRGIEFVLDVDRILEHTNACYFVDGGTLLGFVREGKIIQWDLDIDFGIYISAEYSWKDLEFSLNSIGFILDHQFRYRNEITEQTYRKGAVSIDFFNHFNDESSTYFYAYYSKPGYVYDKTNQMHAEVFKTRQISGTKTLKIGGGYIHVPIEAEKYLEDLYGKTWRIPNPNWKQGSGPACIELGDSAFGLLEDFH